jgi:hypothetical protein
VNNIIGGGLSVEGKKMIALLDLKAEFASLTIQP